METAVSTDEELRVGEETKETLSAPGETKVLKKDQAQDIQEPVEIGSADPAGDEQTETMPLIPRIKMLIKKAGFNNTVFGFVFINSVCITDRTRDDPMVKKAKLLYPEIEISDYSDPEDSV